MSTPHVALQPLGPEHADALDALLRERPAEPRRGLPLPIAGESVAVWVARLAQGPGVARAYVFVAVCPVAGVVGTVALGDVSERTAELSYWIAPSRRGRGYGAAAARAAVAYGYGALWLRRVDAWVSETNAASQRALARAGFVPQGAPGTDPATGEPTRRYVHQPGRSRSG